MLSVRVFVAELEDLCGRVLSFVELTCLVFVTFVVEFCPFVDLTYLVFVSLLSNSRTFVVEFCPLLWTWHAL
ncbi:hypothetical protein Leryth_015398 [Lithospermum erythrorhizon]|nr:hypothetical protein Leryth_015398 [Lithospermum erythrorhizon]